MRAILDNKEGFRVLLAGTVMQLFLGILYVWGVFVIPVSRYYGWDMASAKLTASFMLCFFVLGIFVGGRLQRSLSAGKNVFIGGTLLALGMAAASIVPVGAAWLIHITYGVIGGFGVGVAYNAIISSAQKWFPQNRGLAMGFNVCAFGFSAVLFAPLVEFFIRQFGLQNTFRLLALLFLVASALLSRSIRMPDEPPLQGNTAAPILAQKQYTTAEMIRKKEFYFITLSLMLATSAFFILNPSFKTLAIEKGLDPAMGTALVMLAGVANALGRLVVAYVSDKIGREPAAFSICFATTAGCALLPYAHKTTFILIVAVIAFCYGGYSGMYPVLLADYFGIRNIGSNYGAMMVGFALSAMLFPAFLNRIESSHTVFMALTAITAGATFLVVLLMLSKKTFMGGNKNDTTVIDGQ